MIPLGLGPGVPGELIRRIEARQDHAVAQEIEAIGGPPVDGDLDRDLSARVERVGGAGDDDVERIPPAPGIIPAVGIC
jgi:hypothetical protein